MNFPDTTAKPIKVNFQGVEYRLMGGNKHYYLSQSKSSAGRKGAKGLHVAIYEYVSGKKVPKGHDVHHVDNNPLNNDPKNLQCLTRKEHRATVNARWKKHEIDYIKHLESVRPLAAKWHRSPEGRAWHSEHAKKEKKRNKKGKCDTCDKEFISKKSNARFCSHNCDVKWRQKNERKFSKEKTCVICSVKFTATSYYAKQLNVGKTCSRSCRGKLRSQTVQQAKKPTEDAR